MSRPKTSRRSAMVRASSDAPTIATSIGATNSRSIATNVYANAVGPREVVALGHRHGRLGERGVVVGVGEMARPSDLGLRLRVALPRTQEAAVGAAQLSQQELRVRAGGVEPVVAPERGRRLGEGG